MTKIEQAEKLLSEIEQETKTYFINADFVRECESCGLYYQDVSAWVNGRRKWSTDKLIKVAKMLDIF